MQWQQLGPYRIVKQLGQGGMGTVFEGHDPETGKRVAIKVLSPQLASSEGFRERFEAEIESLKKLRHDSIVRLYGYGEQDGCLYYSMELVEGTTLEDELHAGRRFSWREVTRVGIELSKALKHAHDHGVIHRDIKPANLLQSARGHIKLSDFGIARIFGAAQVTSAGGVLGTAEYMSPEQAGGRGIDERCDQYSLGGVLYALLTGRPPFRASGLPELLQLQRFADPEPVRSFAPDTPAELERIIMQLLEKEPNKRFRNVTVLARQLEAMGKALSRPVATDLSTTRAEMTDERNGSQGSDSSALDPTGMITQMSPLESQDSQGLPDSLRSQGRETSVGEEKGEVAPNSQSIPGTGQPEAGDLGVGDLGAGGLEGNRYTSVEEDGQVDLRRQSHTSLPSSLQRLALVAGLALVVGVAWYFSRPSTADGLYQVINAAVGDDSQDSLIRVEEQVEEFLVRFTDDPRAEQIAGYQERLELERAGRRLSGLARRASARRTLTPIERVYVDAIKLAESSPEQAMTSLQALIDLYDDELTEERHGEASTEKGATEKRMHSLCLKLARSKLAVLDARREREVSDDRKILIARLRRADDISHADIRGACRIWRSVVTLFGDKPWAAELVDRAKSALAASEARLAAEISPVKND